MKKFWKSGFFRKFEFVACLNFLKNFNFEKLSNAERTKQFHKSIQIRFPTLKSKKSPGGGEGNEVHLGLPCGRQKLHMLLQTHGSLKFPKSLEKQISGVNILTENQ